MGNNGHPLPPPLRASEQQRGHLESRLHLVKGPGAQRYQGHAARGGTSWDCGHSWPTPLGGGRKAEGRNQPELSVSQAAGICMLPSQLSSIPHFLHCSLPITHTHTHSNDLLHMSAFNTVVSSNTCNSVISVSSLTLMMSQALL